MILNSSRSKQNFISILNVLDRNWNILVLQRRKRTILILQGKSISSPTLRIVIVFNSGFHCLSKFAFKYSVMQQRYGSSSRSTCSVDFELTGIQIATKPMLGTTNLEHRKLIRVKMMSLFGYGIQFLLFGVLSVLQNLNYNLQKILTDVLRNQQGYQKFVQ